MLLAWTIDGLRFPSPPQYAGEPYGSPSAVSETTTVGIEPAGHCGALDTHTGDDITRLAVPPRAVVGQGTYASTSVGMAPPWFD